MESLSSRSDVVAPPVREQTLIQYPDELVHSPTPSEDDLDDEYELDFDESQCLFCNQPNRGLEDNVVHMSKAHGLHVDRTNLMVDVASLLAYFHLVISGWHECLYCGTQRHTRQAAQQHMMAKGHCKYDIADEDAEFRDFYDLSSSEMNQGRRPRLAARRFSDPPQQPAQVRSKRLRASRRVESHGPEITANPLDQAPPTRTAYPHSDPETSSNVADTPSQSSVEVSARALKHASTLHNQLAHLRADDRRSLLHLPAAQQRALLATQHKQMEKVTRTEQTQRTNLESAGNKFNRLDRIRLMRKPPHFGHVNSLNR